MTMLVDNNMIGKINEGITVSWDDILPEWFGLFSIFCIVLGTGVLFRLWLSSQHQPTSPSGYQE